MQFGGGARQGDRGWIGQACVERRPEVARPTVFTFAFVGLFVLGSVAAPVALLLDEPRISAISLGDFGRSAIHALFQTTAETNIASPALLWLLARGIVEARAEATLSRTGP